MWTGGLRHAPATLPPEITRYPLYRRLGGPRGQSGRVQNISPPPEFDPRAVKPVASRLFSHITTLYISITDTNQLTEYRKIISTPLDCSKEHNYTLCGVSEHYSTRYM